MSMIYASVDILSICWVSYFTNLIQCCREDIVLNTWVYRSTIELFYSRKHMPLEIVNW